MAQFVVRHVESSVKLRLQQRARRNGHSMEEEVRDILRDAVKDDCSQPGLGSECAALFSKIGIKSDLPELRGHEGRPVEFER